jgi:hypothetical protein
LKIFYQFLNQLFVVKTRASGNAADAALHVVLTNMKFETGSQQSLPS